MAILDIVETGHGHVSDLRHELDRVREVLDRTDAVLEVTDETFAKAESAITSTRRATPYVAVGAVVVVAAIVVVAVWRRRRHSDEG